MEYYVEQGSAIQAYVRLCAVEAIPIYVEELCYDHVQLRVLSSYSGHIAAL